MKRYDLNTSLMIFGQLAVAFGILAGTLIMFHRTRYAVDVIPDADTGLGLPAHHIGDSADW